MLKTAAKKVAWVGRTASMVFGLALVLALILGVATTALSATGGNFLLGKPNTASSQTSLVGTVTKAAQSALVVVNKGTGSALNLQVTNTNSPPMKVNSSARVANLNAQFAGHADTADSATSAQNATNAGNADTLDTLDSAALQRRVSTACAPGNSIRAIAEDGTPTCEPDDDTSADQVNALKTELGTNDNAPRAGCDVIEPSASLVHEGLFGRPAQEDPPSRRQRDAKERGRQDLRGEPLLNKTLRGGPPRR
jgi:hypothetical protein